MNLKKDARLRRAARGRHKQRNQMAMRLVVHKTSQHIYAQLLSADGLNTLTAASTLEKELRSELDGKKGIPAAIIVGKAVAQRALKLGYSKVAFDRSGYKYHGRIKALADAAREAGLLF